MPTRAFSAAAALDVAAADPEEVADPAVDEAPAPVEVPEALTAPEEDPDEAPFPVAVAADPVAVPVGAGVDVTRVAVRRQLRWQVSYAAFSAAVPFP